MSSETDAFFNQAILSTLNLEGGYSNHGADRGGSTNFGVTQVVAARHGYVGDMRLIPIEVVHGIYKETYWEKPGFAQVSSYLPALAQYLFDIGVNCGPGTAVMMLQEAVTLLGQNPGEVDGHLGTKTMKALTSLPANLRPRLRQLVGVIHGAHYLEIVRKRPDQRVFLGGWLRRVER